MGWLFGKKKTPRVPFPEPHAGEDTLRFPAPPTSERIIEPNKLKEAAGVVPPPAEEQPVQEPALPMEQAEPQPMAQPVAPVSPVPRPSIPGHHPPLYVKITVYQRILGELDSLKHDLSHLHTVNEHLETSEFNEENNFSKLRRNVRVIHDRLLQMDKTLFKTQGD
jgi:hypothetical protein